MSFRGAALLAVSGLAAAGAACSHPEKTVVDQYFNAVRARDNQTLTSFSAVSFEKPVQSWTIKQTLEETKEPITLPGLAQKLKDAEDALAANKKAASAYSLDRYNEIEQVRELKGKGRPIPAKFTSVAAEWDRFNQKDREARKAVAEAKDALERERRNMALSVGSTANLGGLEGEVKTNKILVDLTIDGQVQPYVLTLRKYDVKGGSGRVVSRWMVQGLQPQG